MLFRNELIPLCMLCCDCCMMRGSRDNFLALSSKSSCQEQTDYKQELRRLQADLEAERVQTLWARGQLGAELRRLREEAEQNHKRAVRELAAKRGGHKDRDRHRCLLAKEGKNKDNGQNGNVESRGESALSCCGKPKLEELLQTLYEEIRGEQVACKQQHRQEFELEKAIFLYRLLEAHRRLLEGTQGDRPPNYKTKNLSVKPIWDKSINPCQTTPLVTCSRTPRRTQSDSPSPKRKSKQDQELLTAASCASAAVGGTCRVSPLKTCHPHRTLHAGGDEQLPGWAESSDESSSSKCPASTMNVSCFAFLLAFFFLLVFISQRLIRIQTADIFCKSFNFFF